MSNVQRSNFISRNFIPLTNSQNKIKQKLKNTHDYYNNSIHKRGVAMLPKYTNFHLYYSDIPKLSFYAPCHRHTRVLFILLRVLGSRTGTIPAVLAKLYRMLQKCALYLLFCLFFTSYSHVERCLVIESSALKPWSKSKNLLDFRTVLSLHSKFLMNTLSSIIYLFIFII